MKQVNKWSLLVTIFEIFGSVQTKLTKWNLRGSSKKKSLTLTFGRRKIKRKHWNLFVMARISRPFSGLAFETAENQLIFKISLARKHIISSVLCGRSQTVWNNPMLSSMNPVQKQWLSFGTTSSLKDSKLTKNNSENLNSQNFFAEKTYRETLTLKRKTAISYMGTPMKAIQNSGELKT